MSVATIPSDTGERLQATVGFRGQVLVMPVSGGPAGASEMKLSGEVCVAKTKTILGISSYAALPISFCKGKP
jgi:hypothetical protein